MGKVVKKVAKVFGFAPPPVPDANANRTYSVHTNQTAPTSYIGVVYGKFRKAGVRIGEFIEHFPNPDNANKLDAYMYAIYALSHGEIENVSNPRMDDVPFTDAKLENFVDWDWGNGAAGQNAATNRLISELSAPNWDTVNGKLGGVAFAVIKLKGDKDEMNKLGNVTFDVTGRTVYDPRSGQTVWSENPALCIADYATNPIYGWGMNYATQIPEANLISAANYFDEVVASSDSNAVGNGKLPARGKTHGYIVVIPAVFDQLRAGQEYTVTNMANAGDNFTGKVTSKEVYKAKEYPSWKDVTIVGQVPDGETEYRVFFDEIKNVSTTFDSYRTLTFAPIVRRYTCNGDVDTSKKLLDNVNLLSSSFNGHISFDSGGRLVILPDKVDPTVMTLDDDILVGEIKRQLVDIDTRHNKVVASWYDPEKGYDEVNEIVESALFKRRDNGQEQKLELSLPFTNNYYIANRICVLELNKSRHGTPIEFSAQWGMLQCTAGDIVAFNKANLAWSGLTFKVVSIGIPDVYGVVKVTAIPYDVNDYTVGVINTRPPRDYLSLSNLVDEPPVTDLTFEEVYGKASYSGKLTWTAPLDREVFSYTVSIGTKAGAVYTELYRYVNIALTSFNIPDALTDGETYYARVMWTDRALRVIMAEAEISFVKESFIAPTGITVVNKSPWAINAYPSYPVGKEDQARLPHKWYIAEFTGSEPAFSENDLVGTAAELSYSGLDPEKVYRIWAKAVNDFAESPVYPSGDGEAFTMASGAAGTTLYYIGYPNGTAIKNGAGTLTVEAHKIEGGVDTVLSGAPADPQLYDGATPLGYSANFNSASINGSKVIQLKDGSTILDSVTLVDVLDGEDAVVPSVSTNAPLSWTRAPQYGAWTPGTTTCDVTFTFYRKGASIATHTVRVTLNTSNGNLSAATLGTPSGETTSLAITGNNTASIALFVTHTASGVKGVENLLTVQAGLNGVPGTNGTNGTTYYTWIKYSYSANGANPSDDPTGRDYIGIATNQIYQSESTDPSYYTWSKITGEDGIGIDGEDGITHYVWVKYSDYANGQSPYDIPNSNTKYIGIAPNKTVAAESDNPADYTWSQFKGDPGQTGSQGPTGEDGLPGSNAEYVNGQGNNVNLLRGSEVLIAQITATKTATWRSTYNAAGGLFKMSGTTNPSLTFRAYKNSTLLSSSTTVSGANIAEQWQYVINQSLNSGDVISIRAYASWPVATDAEGDASGNLTITEIL